MAKSGRYFRNDVFLSHNQKDGSLALRDELLKRDVAAWHDGDADMSDRDVLYTVRSALDDSRLICVCVRAGFRDSEWVRAEYMRGLELTRKSGACCVIVAEMTPGAEIPSALQDQPRFRLYAEGLEPLAAYARAANHRKPIPDERVVPNAEQLRKDGVKLRSHNPTSTGGRLVGVSEDEHAKLLLGSLRASRQDVRLAASRLIGTLRSVEYIKDRQVLLDIYREAAARDDVLAEASRSFGDDQHYPLEVLLHPLSEFAREPATHAEACELHERILTRVAAIHRLSPEIVALFRRYHTERLAGRWVDTRKPRPAPKHYSRWRIEDAAMTVLGALVVVAGVAIFIALLNTG